MRRLALLLMLVAGLVAGCGTPGGDSGDNAKQAAQAEHSSHKIDVAKAGDVTLTVWDQEVRGGQRRQIEQLNAAFQRGYPNVTIKRVAKSFTDLNTTLKLAVSSDKAPDVVQANQGRQVMGQLVKGGLLRPLDGYADAYGWGDRYPQVLLDLNRFSPDGRTFGAGKLYGISQMGEIVGLYYDRDKVPEPPRTFAELEQQLAGAKRRGEIPISFGNLDKWPGIHEFQAVQNEFARGPTQVRDFVFAREGATFAAERAGGGRSSRSGRRRATSRRTSTASARPGVAAVLQGRRPVPDRRHVAAARPHRRDGRQPRLHAGAAARGGRRPAALGGESLPFAITVEVEEPRRGRRLHRLPHQRQRRARAGRHRQPAGDADDEKPTAARRQGRLRGLADAERRATAWCRTSTTRRPRSTTTSPPASSGCWPAAHRRASSSRASRTTTRSSPDRPDMRGRRASRAASRTCTCCPGWRCSPRSCSFRSSHAGWISLFAWDGITPGEWVGLDNYAAARAGACAAARVRALGGAARLLRALPVAIGLLLAAAASRVRVRGLSALRAILFLPQVIALVVVAVTWRIIYQPTGWLGNFDLALPAVGLVGTWVAYGLCFVLFMAGVQKVPQSLYDAARVDGAGAVREFFAVTLPALRGEIAVALTLTTIAALRNFDLVYLTTAEDRATPPRCPRSRSISARSAPARWAARRRSGLPGGRDLRAVVRHQPRGRPGGAHVIDRREQYWPSSCSGCSG